MPKDYKNGIENYAIFISYFMTLIVQRRNKCCVCKENFYFGFLGASSLASSSVVDATAFILIESRSSLNPM